MIRYAFGAFFIAAGIVVELFGYPPGQLPTVLKSEISLPDGMAFRPAILIDEGRTIVIGVYTGDPVIKRPTFTEM